MKKIMPKWFWDRRFPVYPQSKYFSLLNWFVFAHLKLKMSQMEWALYLKAIRQKLPIEADPYVGAMCYGDGPNYWDRYYLPKDGAQGKRILDAGADCGSTAWYYLRHGASSIICIEEDKARVRMLRRNANRLGWNVEIYQRKFMQSDMFDHDIDFAKIDCEGGEDEVLGIEEEDLPPLVMEIHNEKRYDTFRARYPHMEIVRPDPRDLWMARWKA